LQTRADRAGVLREGAGANRPMLGLSGNRAEYLEDLSAGEATDSDGDVVAGYTTHKVEQASLAENPCFLRTERALRFTLGAIGPLILSFGYKSPMSGEHSLLPFSMSYLIGIFYVIFAALLPPQLSSLSIIFGGAVSGLLIGLPVASFAFAVELVAESKTMGLLAFAAGLFVISSLKTGNTQALTNLPQLVAVYGSVIAFVMIENFAYPGLQVTVPTNMLMTVNDIVGKNEELKKVLPDSLWDTAINTFLYVQKICKPGANATCKPVEATIPVPSGELKGFEMGISLGPDVTSLNVHPSLSFLRVIWTGSGAVGVVRPIVALIFICIGFLALSLVLPLPRVRTAYNVVRAELVRVMGGPLRKTLLAAEDAVMFGRQRTVVLEETGTSAKSVTDRMASLLSASKIAAFEPSWPALGVSLLKVYPNLVSAVRRCARYAESIAGGGSARKDIESRVLRSSRAVVEASADLLAAMPHSGDDLTGIPGGLLDKLNSAVSNLQNADEQLPADEESWALRHGIVEGALAVAQHSKEIEEIRCSANRNMLGAAKGFGMMLVGFLVPLFLPFYRLIQPLINLLKGRKRGGGCDLIDLRTQLGLVVGVVALVAPSLYVPWWNEIGLGPGLGKMIGMKGKFCTWCVLGFIVSFQNTLEGALHKSAMRILGTLLGAASGWVCVAVCGKNTTAIIVYLLASYAVAVARAANPINALLGFNISWGYAAQLFTYTQTIIVIEATIGIDTIEDLAKTRVLGQLLGIGTALVCSFMVFVRAGPTAKARVADAFELLDAGLNDLCESQEKAAEECFLAAEAKLEAAQLTLDDAKVDVIHGSRQLMVRPGGQGLEHARNVLNHARDALQDCCLLVRLLTHGRVAMPEELAAEGKNTGLVFKGAAEHLRLGKSSSPTHQQDSRPASEVAWLMRRAANAARLAALVQDDEDYGESSQDEDLA